VGASNNERVDRPHMGGGLTRDKCFFWVVAERKDDPHRNRSRGEDWRERILRRNGVIAKMRL